jgi:hypothetical protein
MFLVLSNCLDFLVDSNIVALRGPRELVVGCIVMDFFFFG